MRHIIWLKADGSIGGFHIITGGWAPDFDPNDLTESNTQAKFVRDHHAANPSNGFHSFFEYECPCSPSAGFCDCPNNTCANCHVDGGLLKIKPTLSLLLTNQVVGATSEIAPLVLAAGAEVPIKFTGSLPDTTVVSVDRVGGPDSFDTLPTTFTFGGNETPEQTFLVPAKGQISVFRIDAGKYVRPRIVVVKGW